MAYVRQRGNQLAIVQGERDPKSGRVEQKILFTFYSKAEVKETLGRAKASGKTFFQSLLEDEYPGIKFNWKVIYRDIEKSQEILPEVYQHGAVRLRERFHGDLCTLTRQLILTDPQELDSAAQLIREYQHELKYLGDLIQWRLDCREQEPSEWNVDDAFHWRFTLRGGTVPPEIEEEVAEFYEQGEYDRAEAVFRLFIDCFDGYAEGYNYLGLIALKKDKVDEAINHFRKTIELGRKLFPKRISKESYWNDHATRPYMRGLKNLTYALIQAGQYDEALELCERLTKECGDDISASSFRSSVYLNTKRWHEASEAAMHLHRVAATESFVAAFAFFEMNSKEDALTAFLHGALNHPRMARLLVGIKMPAPTNGDDVEGHNSGIYLIKQIGNYLKDKNRLSLKFFKRVVMNPKIVGLLDEMAAITKHWENDRSGADRSAYNRMQLMKTPEFAREKAGEFDLLLAA